MIKPIVSIIACVEMPSFGVGYKGRLIASFKEDMERFKELTTGHPVIMGRKTWDSLPLKYRPLPGRTNIVLTRSHANTVRTFGGKPVDNMRDAVTLAKDSDGQGHIFVIGGGNVWKDAAPYVDRIYLTEFEGEGIADTFFPRSILDTFDIKKMVPVLDHKTGKKFRFVDYHRIGT